MPKPELSVEDAIAKAFQHGQTYWHQADSESHSQNKKSDVTLQKYIDLKESFGAQQ